MSSYPPFWGRYFWDLLHMSAYMHLQHDRLDPADARVFVRLLCELLPCPACSDHCSEYLEANPLSTGITNGVSYWSYLVRLHNTVNTRTGKLELSERDAERHVVERLASLGVRANDLVSHLAYSHWLVLAMVCNIHGPHTAHAFVRAWCRMVPFGYHRTATDTVRDVLGEYHAAMENAEWTLESVECMYTRVCESFGCPALRPGQLAHHVSTLPNSVLECLVHSEEARVQQSAPLRSQHQINRRLTLAAACIGALCMLMVVGLCFVLSPPLHRRHRVARVNENQEAGYGAA